MQNDAGAVGWPHDGQDVANIFGTHPRPMARVVRYDNFHGFLHRQRFWRSEQPERVPAHERTSIRILVR